MGGAGVIAHRACTPPRDFERGRQMMSRGPTAGRGPDLCSHHPFQHVATQGLVSDEKLGLGVFLLQHLAPFSVAGSNVPCL